MHQWKNNGRDSRAGTTLKQSVSYAEKCSYPCRRLRLTRVRSCPPNLMHSLAISSVELVSPAYKPPATTHRYTRVSGGVSRVGSAVKSPVKRRATKHQRSSGVNAVQSCGYRHVRRTPESDRRYWGGGGKGNTKARRAKTHEPKGRPG